MNSGIELPEQAADITEVVSPRHGIVRFGALLVRFEKTSSVLEQAVARDELQRPEYAMEPVRRRTDIAFGNGSIDLEKVRMAGLVQYGEYAVTWPRTAIHQVEARDVVVGGIGGGWR